MLITSVQNPKVKAVVQLHQRKAREQEGLILIEGPHPIEEAVQAGLELMDVYCLEKADVPALNVDCPVTEVSRDVMAKMATTDSPPPVLAVAKPPRYSAEALFSAPEVRLLAATSLQDPGNMGTLIRSACAFGATGMLLIGPHVDATSPKVIRASAGLVFRMPVATLADIAALAAQLSTCPGLRVWGADAHQGPSYRAVEYGHRHLLLMGGEAHGLPQSVWQVAQPVHIPMAPQAESLNVAVAGAIILSEIFQQGKKG